MTIRSLTARETEYANRFYNKPHGYIFYHVSLKDSRGEPVKCRVNGKCKLWKRSPGKFRLPVKYGLYQCFYITEANANEWVD